MAMNDNPLLDYLGIKLVDWKPRQATFALDIEARHLNRLGVLQGGVAATLLDVAGGYAGLLPDGGGAPQHAVTVMLTISYLAKVQAGRLTAIGKMTSAGRKLYFATAELVAEDGRLIATAQGTFKIMRGATESA